MYEKTIFFLHPVMEFASFSATVHCSIAAITSLFTLMSSKCVAVVLFAFEEPLKSVKNVIFGLVGDSEVACNSNDIALQTAVASLFHSQLLCLNAWPLDSPAKPV